MLLSGYFEICYILNIQQRSRAAASMSRLWRGCERQSFRTVNVESVMLYDQQLLC